MIHWFTLYSRGKFLLPVPESMLEWINATIKEVFKDRERHIISFGYLVNPASNDSYQPFHIDYSHTDSNIMVPLTPLLTENAPQYLTRPVLKTPVDERNAFPSVAEIAESEGWDYVEVGQMTAKPYTLLHMLPGTAHRGIPNKSGQDRIVFWIGTDDYYHELTEPSSYEFSTTKYGPIK